MFRTAAIVAVAVLVALAIGNVVFGVVGGVVGLLLSLAWVLLKILIIGGLAYFIISLVSPDTARRIREAIGGAGSGTPPQA